MNCPNCGAPNNEGVAYCVNCGAPLNAQPVQPVQPAYGYQPQPTQPVYGYAPVQPAKVPGKGLGIAGMVLGIISIVFLCIADTVTLIGGILGLILSGIGLSKAKAAGMKNGMAVAGIVCSCISIGLWLCAVIFLASLFASVGLL